MTYRETARFYDLFGSKSDAVFYLELARKSGAKALELGVGTGRLAIQLARAGVKILGLDSSPHMLKIAQDKLAKETKGVKSRTVLRIGDMRAFELGQKFPFIYIPASTFDHNVTVHDQRRTLTCIHEHLTQKGTLAFDLELGSLDRVNSSWWIDRRETEEGTMVVRSIFTRKNSLKRVCEMDLFFDVFKNGILQERFHEYGKVAILSKDRIVKLLRDTGFEVESVFGDFEKGEYQKGSTKLVIIAGKKQSSSCQYEK